jgi:uncharacterized protein (DUF2267 family)
MHTQPGQRQNTASLAYSQMLETVRYDGVYPTRERAEQAVHTVLAALGRQLNGGLRAEIATHLPAEAARTLTAQTSAAQPRTGWSFVQDIATRTDMTPAVARWETGAVLNTVAALAGPELITRVLAELPSGYALLFGRAELVQAA